MAAEQARDGDPPAIDISGLTKSYGRRTALNGVDLRVREGEVFGFLGPNGSGKTTTIRVLLDHIRRDAGSVSVLGRDPRTDGVALRREVGYLPGELTMAGRRSAGDLLGFYARLRGGVPRARIEELAGRLGLDLRRPVRGLSKGNKQKVGLVQAFMHRPRLLILDEPTSGLDPLLQQEFLAMVRQAREAGATVFMSSHVLSEVHDAADRAAIIRDGRIVATEDMDALRARAVHEFSIRFAEPLGEAEAREFGALENVRGVRTEGDRLTCTVDGSPDALVKLAARRTVLLMSAVEPDLEELFFTHYADGADGGAAREGGG
ncbi:ABC transporter ATP-binding protein [Nocardiopsis halophila]|uniref:ABC transporter ATP-binding protein n=1 Tax=Nocardiopsis halophila TaxID=141692 RepID=UPI00034631C2|nr:ABC transporter ATP-binding protein [Nocardiopsis halophila]